MRAVDELLADHALKSMCALLSALLRTAATIAVQHARLVTAGPIDLYSASRAHRPEGVGRRFYPLQPVQRAEFAAGYRVAARACQTAATSLAPLSRGPEAPQMAALSAASRPVVRLDSHKVQPMPPRSQQPASGRSIAPGG
jgi:hypothetical protein